MPMICEHCQHPTRAVFQQGDGQLWCKVCHQNQKFSGQFDVSTHVVRDEYPGGPITLENYGAKPVTFSCESERQAHMVKHEMHLKERWCPFPGTDRDPSGVQNPDGYIDQVTMDNRAELFLRANNRKTASEVQTIQSDDVSHMIKRTFSGTLTNRDAKAIAEGDPIRLSRLHRRMSNGG